MLSPDGASLLLIRCPSALETWLQLRPPATKKVNTKNYIILIEQTFSNALILSCAPPLPPDIIAPACPILRPGGAESPAMKDTTGLALGP